MGDDQMTGDEVATALGRLLTDALVGGGAHEMEPTKGLQGGMRVELSGISLSVARITLDYPRGPERITGER